MKLAIVGTRNPSISYEEFKEKLGQVIFYKVDAVVSGGAVGIDAYAKRYAVENNLPLIEHLPAYETYGRRAPLMRNTLIVNDSFDCFCIHILFLSFSVSACKVTKS